MNLYFLAAIVIVLAGIFSLFKDKIGFAENEEKKLSDEDYRYYIKKNYLMSPAEHDFFMVLKETVKDKYIIVPQVQLCKIVEVNKYEHRKAKYLRNRIDKKSVDFVLFNNAYMPEIVIELDDSSHLLPERENRDKFVDEVLDRVGIKILHVPYSKNYDLREMFGRIQSL